MTATARIWEAPEHARSGEGGESRLIASMDPGSRVFGPVAYKLTLSQAVSRGEVVLNAAGRDVLARLCGVGQEVLGRALPSWCREGAKFPAGKGGEPLAVWRAGGAVVGPVAFGCRTTSRSHPICNTSAHTTPHPTPQPTHPANNPAGLRVPHPLIHKGKVELTLLQ